MRTGFITVVVIGHAVVVVVAFTVASWLRYGEGSEARWNQLLASPVLALAGYMILAVFVFNSSGLYRFDKRWTAMGALRDSVRAVTILAIITLTLLYLFKLEQVSRLFLASFFTLVWAGISLTTLFVRELYARRRASGRGVRHILIVGTNPAVLPLVSNLINNHPELGARVVGYLGSKPGMIEGVEHLGPTESLVDVLATSVIDEVIVAPDHSDLRTMDAAVYSSQQQGKTVRIPLETMSHSIQTGEVESLDGVPLLTVGSGPPRSIGYAIKRLIDIVIATVALIVLSPVLVIVAIVILVTDGRPVIYADVRAGIHGRPIRIHKFRTMVTNANEIRAELAGRNSRVGPDFKVIDDPRITQIGGFLRKTSLDELPQFWDVFVGRMSLVGPRAQRLDEVAGYDAWHRRRLSVKPGLTGLWQVRARQDPSFEVRAQLDLKYIDSWSPGLDLRIMLETIPAILRSTGS